MSNENENVVYPVPVEYDRESELVNPQYHEAQNSLHTEQSQKTLIRKSNEQGPVQTLRPHRG